MKKTLTFLFVLACSVGLLQSQAWYVYDGSAIPTDLAGWDASSNAPGPNFVERVVNDPDIKGNKLLLYMNLDEFQTGTTKSSKYYRYKFNANVVKNLTIVARLKGIPVDSIDNEMIAQLDLQTVLRETIKLQHSDSLIDFDNADTSIKADADLNEWHIYRVIIQKADSSVALYLDENTTPILTGKTATASTNNYLRFGDAGSARVAGYTDWMVIDTTGAYAPGEGAPIPDSLSRGYGANSDKEIAFITKLDNLNPQKGYYADTMFVDALVKEGYKVSVAYVKDKDWDIEKLNYKDLVIIGRAANSSDFKNTADWATVKTPVLLLSQYIARNSRLKWFNTGDTDNWADASGVLKAKFHDLADPIVEGITLGADSTFDFLTETYGLIHYGADSLERTSNAKLLASASAHDTMGGGQVVAARWDQGVEFYAGAGAVQQGIRSYLGIGTDAATDDLGQKLYNYWAFTAEGKQMWLNEVEYLMQQYEVPAAPGLVAYWKLDENHGLDIMEEIQGADGLIVGDSGVARIDGVLGSALDFSKAVDTAVAIVEDSDATKAINFTNESFTVSILAKYNPTVAEQAIIFMKGDNGSDGPNGNGNRYEVASKSGKLRFALDDNVTKTSLDVTVPDNYPVNEWALITGVRNVEIDSILLYVNGTEIGRKLDATGSIDVDSQRVIIGNYHSLANPLKGALDEIQIYNKALTADEILAMAEAYDVVPEVILVTGITVAGAGDAITVDVGSTLQMGETVLPADATDMTVTWSVSDAGIATIDASGLLMGVSAGLVKVTATANDASGVKGTLDITVVDTVTSVAPNEVSNIGLYYNSTDDLVQIRNSSEVMRVEIFSVTGQKIYSLRVHNQESIQISANKLQRGVFIVRMQLGDNRTYSVRFVK